MKLTALRTLCVTLCCLSMSVKGTSFSELEELISKTKAVANVPSGTAIAVVKGDKIIYQKNFGYADIENKRLVDGDTSFYIASATKPYFALTTLMLESNGKLREDTSLKQMFPDTRFNQFDPSQITVKHLLSHTMGIDNLPLVMTTAYTGDHDLKRRQVLVSQSVANEAAPLNQFEYSNVGYNILSVWLDQSGPFEWQQLMQQQVFGPLGMQRTSAYISAADDPDWTLAKPYSVRSGDHQPLYLSKKDNTMHSAGGMISSANDMANFVKLQLNGGKLNGKQAIPKSIIDKSQQILTKADSSYGEFKREGYAWGWFVGPYLDQQLYHHFGGYSGTHSHMSFMPEKGLGLVILNNEDMLSSRMTGLIAKGIYAHLLGQEDNYQEAVAQFNGLQQKLTGLAKMLAQQKDKLAKREWKLSLDKGAYSGQYQHPEYGTIGIEQVSDSKIKVTWGQMYALATPFTEENTLRVELIPNRGEVIKFNIDGKKVLGLTYKKADFSRVM